MCLVERVFPGGNDDELVDFLRCEDPSRDHDVSNVRRIKTTAVDRPSDHLHYRDFRLATLNRFAPSEYTVEIHSAQDHTAFGILFQ